jgi:hypothetical protein
MLGLDFSVSLPPERSTELTPKSQAKDSIERSGLTLHFDKLSVLSVSKEAALYTPP